jgi:hypothetical protein
MPLYRVISLDTLTGARVAEIPLANLKYGASYKSGIVTGYVTGDLTLPELVTTADRTTANILNDAVDKYRRHLFVERDGVVMEGGDGIVWSNPYDPEKMARSITAGSTETYLSRRFITTPQDFTGVDQLTIARTLINSALAEVNGNPGITVGAETSGVLRDRSYKRYDVKNLGQALEELCSVENGFDLSIDCSWNSSTGAPIKRLRLSYPRRGRNFTQSKHVFELGRNATMNWPAEREMANRVHGIGDGMGDSMLISTVVDPSSFASNYPLLETTFSAKTVREQATLDIQTRAYLASVSRPLVLPKLIVRADLDPILGSYIVGDACKVRSQPGFDPMFPDGLEVYRRISDIDVTVDGEGGEVVEITTMEEPDA